MLNCGRGTIPPFTKKAPPSARLRTYSLCYSGLACDPLSKQENTNHSLFNSRYRLCRLFIFSRHLSPKIFNCSLLTANCSLDGGGLVMNLSSEARRPHLPLLIAHCSLLSESNRSISAGERTAGEEALVSSVADSGGAFTGTYRQLSALSAVRADRPVNASEFGPSALFFFSAETAYFRSLATMGRVRGGGGLGGLFSALEGLFSALEGVFSALERLGSALGGLSKEREKTAETGTGGGWDAGLSMVSSFLPLA
jgi:hypothetical protein